MFGFIYRLGVAILGLAGVLAAIVAAGFASNRWTKLEEGVIAAAVVMALTFALALIWRWVCLGGKRDHPKQPIRERQAPTL